MKTTLEQRRAIRQHMTDNGIDPQSVSAKAFIQYGKAEGILDGKPAPTKRAHKQDRDKDRATDAAPVAEAARDEDGGTVADENADDTREALADKIVALAKDRGTLDPEHREQVREQAKANTPPPAPPNNADESTEETIARLQQHAANMEAAADAAEQSALEQHQQAVDEELDALADLLTQKLQDEKEKDEKDEKDDEDVQPLEITLPEHPDEPERFDTPHSQLATVVRVLRAGLNVWLTGPAGSGKTTLGTQAARALKTEFYFSGKLSEEYQLTGYNDANGNYVPTAFYNCCVNGGLFLFDEVDASDDKAVTRFNAALANGWCDFPCGRVEIDAEKTFFIAAANTAGQGGNRVYLRNQLDGATLDRFVEIQVEYDEVLELKLALASYDDDETRELVRWVQAARAAASAAGLKIIISPRASIHGAKLLSAGFDVETVKQMTVYKSESEDVIAILSSAG